MRKPSGPVIRRHLENVASAYHTVKRHNDAGSGFDLLLAAVLNLQRSVKPLRGYVRSQATKEKRAACSHPEASRLLFTNGAARCRLCGQEWPSPLKSL